MSDQVQREAGETGPDIELARLRLHQAEQRIVSRFPSAARDGQLASILEGLGDALGDGPEAAEPEVTGPGTATFSKLLSPDLLLAVDGSANIVLVVTEPHGRLLRVVGVGNVDEFKAALDTARQVQGKVMDEAEQSRLGGRDERRRAEGKLTKGEAVEWLVSRPLSRQRAVQVAADLQNGAPGGPFTDGMTYDGTYWVIPAGTDAI